ncbi:hypothetical protein GCM10022419_131860 [Nonomuraea rosea]|uniref:DUF4158 domain-containing protein n=1 Tax=Nonomuraea rosea TaxID=638574 RepID=A0ABP7A2R3_9ACTN
MPVSFLTEDQRSRWGKFNEVPGLTQLGGFFHLEVADRRRAMAANGARNQLAYAVQLGTARFLNCVPGRSGGCADGGGRLRPLRIPCQQ